MQPFQSPIVPLKTGKAGLLDLFCFPFAGGGPSAFRPVVRALESDVQVYALQPPGREGRLHEEPLLSIKALAEEAATAIRAISNRACVFWGHSMGSLVAYETALCLTATRDLHLQSLIVGATAAPQGPPRLPLYSQMSDFELIQQLKRLSGTPQAILKNPEVMQFMLPILRADLYAAEHYCFTTCGPLQCPIAVLAGSKDPMISRDQYQGWRELTTAPCTIHIFSGGHLFPLEQPTEVGAFLSDHLQTLRHLMGCF